MLHYIQACDGAFYYQDEAGQLDCKAQTECARGEETTVFGRLVNTAPQPIQVPHPRHSCSCHFHNNATVSAAIAFAAQRLDTSGLAKTCCSVLAHKF
jgi:hypothetical protein